MSIDVGIAIIEHKYRFAEKYSSDVLFCRCITSTCLFDRMRIKNKFLELATNHLISCADYTMIAKRPLSSITSERCEFVGASYKKLWHLLIDRGMKKRELCQMAGVSASSLAKLGKGENVNTDILIKICRALDVGMNDIMEILPDEHD